MVGTFPAPTTETAAEDGSADRTQTVTQREALGLLLGELDDVQRGIDDGRERFERLLHLAATGMAAERVVHEFGRQVAAASRALRELRSLKGVRDSEALPTLESVLATLEAEFRVLAPYETLGRAPRTRMISLRELADLALRLNDHLLREAGVLASVEGDDLIVSGRAVPILQILDNLVHNATYWLETLEPGLDRRLGILLYPDRSTVLVADSGPGLTEEATVLAFEPFFSMKEGGSGLGLYISAELAKATGGRLGFADRPALRDLIPEWATGAVFELMLERPEGAGNGRA